MRDDSTSAKSVTGRRTVLATGSALLAGLGSYPSVLAAGAREEPDRPTGQQRSIGSTDVQSGADEWNGEGRSDDSDDDPQRTITDETRTVQITVPEAWDDVNSTQVGNNPSIIAAPDLDGYLTTRDVPGVEVAVTTRLGGDLAAILDRLVDYSHECDDGGRQRFRSDEFTFRSQIWRRCDGDDTIFLTIVGAPVDDQPDGTSDAPYVLLIGAQIVTEPDADAISAAIESLEIRSSDGQFLRTE